MPAENSDAEKGKEEPQKPKIQGEVAPDLQAVVTTPATVRKKRTKVRDLFIAEDMKTVSTHVFYEMFVPYSKQMMFSLGQGVLHRMLFGISTKIGSLTGIPMQNLPNPGSMTRFSYNTPVNRTGQNPLQQLMNPGNPGGRMAPMLEQGPRRSSSPQDEHIVGSRDEALHILSVMGDVLQNYGVVTVRQFKQLCGVIPEQFTDENFGWTAIPGARVVQAGHGYLIDLPPPRPLTAEQ